MVKRLSLIIFALVFSLFNATIISSYEFPDVITCNEHGLVTNYGLRIYKKYCVTDYSNLEYEEKAFCTWFWRDAAHGKDCGITKWSDDEDKNTAISYAIGHIIKKYDVNAFDASYTLAESAINEFLYKLTNDKSKYAGYPLNISNASANSRYRNIVNEASSIYDNRVNGKDNTKNNSKKIKIDSKKIKSNGELSVKLVCYNEYGEETCASATVSATIGNTKYDLITDDNSTYTLDLTNIRKGYESNQKYTINITASQTLKYYEAKNYECGGYQSMTLNRIIEHKEVSTDKANITDTGTKNNNATCQSLVTQAKNEYGNNKNLASYYGKLLKIYKASTGEDVFGNGKKCIDCISNAYGEVLNLENPSCNKIKNNHPKLTCDGISTNYKFLQSKTNTSGTKVYYYCTSKFNLDASSVIGKSQNFNQGGLLYYSEDSKIATGSLLYDCMLPDNSSINIDVTLPKLSLNVNQKDAIVANFTSTLTDNSGNTDNNIVLNSTNPSFEGTVKYSYPENFNYKLLKGSTIQVVNNCENGNCINYGYGFKTDATWANGISNLTINADNNIMKINQNVSCDYLSSPMTNKRKANLLYRGIDTSSPFLTYDGKPRTTGANWCEVSVEEDKPNKSLSIGVKENTNNGINIKGIYKDVDSNNYYSIFDFNENGYLDLLDVKVLANSLANGNSFYFKKDINLDYYSNYNFSSVYSSEQWSDYYDNFSSNVIGSGFCNTCISDPSYEVYFTKNLNGIYDVNIRLALESILKTTFMNSVSSLNEEQGLYPTYSLIDIKIGDINFDGKIDNNDYNELESIINSGKSFNELIGPLGQIVGKSNYIKFYYADCDRDGYLNNKDLVCIKSIYDSTLEIERNEDGSLKETIEIKEDGFDSKLITDSNLENSVADRCSASNQKVQDYILNKPNSNGIIKNEINGVLTTIKTEPIYSFTLTPSTIKKIRKYNDSNSYDDFNLTCMEGKNCISDFVSDLFNGAYGEVNAKGKCSNRASFCEVIE